MGIKCLTKLLKQKSPDSIQTEQLHKLSGKKVAIDSSLFIYQFLMNGSHPSNHISGIFYKTINYLSLNIEPIYIFDGKPPEQKCKIIEERKKKAENAKNKIQICTNHTDIKKYEKQCIRMTQKHVIDIKKLLNLMGVTYLHIDGEAEAIASELCRIGYVDYVVTEDMDSLPFGCPKLIRTCLDKSIKRNDLISILNLEKVLEDLQISYEQFVELCILCGCDYCSNIPRIGNVTAFNIIKMHGSIENFLKSNIKYNVPDNYEEIYKKSKELFMMYRNKLNVDELPFNKSLIDKSYLQSYLVNECKLPHTNVSNAIKKLNNIYIKKT